METGKLILAVAAGVVLGGTCLCGGIGLLMSRPIFGEMTPARKAGLTKSQYERRRQNYLVSDIKQIGLAAIKYSADNDDILPGPSGFTVKVRPYLSTRETSPDLVNELSRALDDTIWTFPGGAQTAIADIQRTELGYLRGSNGRAVVYADGHGAWVPDDAAP